jgi:hypothetical protein
VAVVTMAPLAEQSVREVHGRYRSARSTVKRLT